MNAPALQAYDRIRTSYWFVPSLMAVVAAVLALLAILIDQAAGPGWFERVPLLHNISPDAARELLATVAGSIITVAGVTFSITIVTVVNAASRYGPRLLRNFLRDRGNQATLGTLIATFLFCLVVLGAIRGPAQDGAGGGFVPHIGLLAAGGFTLASLGMLIYFIHHVPESVEISNITAALGRKLARQLCEPLPGHVGRDADARAAALPPEFDRRAAAATAELSGYIQTVDAAGLLARAARRDLIVRMERHAGDFVSRRQPLLRVWPPDALDEALLADLRECFTFGAQRTDAQDPMLTVNELVELTAIAMSTGINDSFTACACMRWLQSALILRAGHGDPSPLRADDDGRLRLVVHPITFDSLLGASLDTVRPYVAHDRIAATCLMNVIADVATVVGSQSCLAALRRQGDLLRAAATREIPAAADRAELEAAYQRLVALTAADCQDAGGQR